MFTFTLTLEVPEGQDERFIELTKPYADAARGEEDCLMVDMLRSSKRQNVFMLYEAFENKAAFERHIAQEYTKQWMYTTQEMVTEAGFNSEFVSQSYDHYDSFKIEKGEYHA